MSDRLQEHMMKSIMEFIESVETLKRINRRHELGIQTLLVPSEYEPEMMLYMRTYLVPDNGPRTPSLDSRAIQPGNFELLGFTVMGIPGLVVPYVLINHIPTSLESLLERAAAQDSRGALSETNIIHRLM